MAISLEELTAVAPEGSVGPLTLVVAAGRSGQRSPVGWIVAARRRRSSLVEEARAEYEAGRAPASAATAPSIVLATGAVPEAGSVIVVPGAEHVSGSPALPEETGRTGDRRGRFVRRATNGVRPE